MGWEWRRLGAELKLEPLRNLLAGLVSGSLLLSENLSAGLLIYGGVLSPYLASGLAGLLISTAFLNCLGVNRQGLVYGIATPDSRIYSLLAIVAAAISQSEALVDTGMLGATLLIYWIVTATSIGVALWLMGRLGLGEWLRYIPYPVVGGFLAATGWLLISGGFNVALGFKLSAASLDRLWNLDSGAKLLVAVVFGLLLWQLGTRLNRVWITPALLFSGLVGAHLIRLGLGVSLVEAAQAGWFLPKLTPRLIFFWNWPAIPSIDWALLWPQFAVIPVLILLAAISLTLNLSSLENIEKRELDLNQELQRTGLTNLIMVPFGGFSPGLLSGSRSTLNRLAGASTPLAAWVAAGLMLVAVSLGDLAQWLCKPVLAGLLINLGLLYIDRWVFRSIRLLPQREYWVTIAILGISIVAGFLEAITAGILFSSLTFIVSYCRAPVIRSMVSGAYLHSNIERVEAQQAILRRRGAVLQVVFLQGYLFFGTARRIVAVVRDRLSQSPEEIRLVLLDYQAVTGADSSTAEVFSRFAVELQARSVQLWVSAIAPEYQKPLQLFLQVLPGHQQFPDLNAALQAAEAQLLERYARRPKSLPFALLLPELLRLADDCEVPLQRWQRSQLKDSQVLYQQGDRAETLYWLERGELYLQATEAWEARQVLAGSPCGELAFLRGETQPQTAIAVGRCTVYGLSRTALAELEQSHPMVAIALYRWLLHRQSEQLHDQQLRQHYLQS
ncbi:SulP family inorganic anion transporter [Synechococcus elongatus]|uniref:SulP family inorganic anion transporter n=1 Tax=Synechococcus elongatus PCC 11802 TaxID=2283154 RepID=A0AAT9K004_SYNEL|nr:SulP family inorganic anion transporter [Synechococcus elongatus]QFZ91048.1 cyclic nucleotide-binding domain-containing protein [Synechococcus elongatus PCC 11802]